VDCFQVRAGHGENVGGAVDQRGGERLAADAADVHAFLFADVDCVQARRLPADCVDPGRSDFDLLAIAEETPEQAFRHRAPANISRANEEDAFHDFTPARAGRGN